MPERTQIQQFGAFRVVAGQRTAGWANLVDNIRDFLVGNPEVLFLDLWIEQAADQSRGAEGLVAYLLYREVDHADAVVPMYTVLEHQGPSSAPDWFNFVTDTLGLDVLVVHVAVAPPLTDSDVENGKQYLLVGIQTADGDGAVGAIGGSYVGTAQIGIPPLATGAVELFSSDGAASYGIFPVLNRSDTNAVAPGGRLLVAHDPMSGMLVTIPRCC